MTRGRKRSSQDNRLAFERLFRAHYADVLAYVRRRTAGDEAADVVADTFLVAWRRLEDVPEDALPWLLAVARRALANQTRADRRRDALRAKVRSLDTRADVPGEPEIDPELLSALRKLPNAEREAILLIAWEGLTPRQAAASLGCSRVALRARVHRARRRLAKELADNDGGGHQIAQLTSLKEEPS